MGFGREECLISFILPSLSVHAQKDAATPLITLKHHKMKKLITLGLSALLYLSANAQVNKDTVGINLPFKDSNLLYTGVVTISNKTKIDLYKNAQQWFVDYFNSSKAVIQNQDKEDGLIVGKGILKFASKIGMGMTMPFGDNVTVKIECKDGKYRYSFYDISITYFYNGTTDFTIDEVMDKLLGRKTRWGWSKKVAKGVLANGDEKVKESIAALNQAMNKTPTDF